MFKTIFNHLCSLSDIILVSDFNASFTDHSNINLYKAKTLKQFRLRADNDFSNSGSNFTFTTPKTTLDYIMCNKSQRNHVNQYRVYEESSFSSTSDYLLILMVLSINFKCNVICNPRSQLPAWHKAEVNKLLEYNNIISEQCTTFCTKICSTGSKLKNFA